MNQKVFTIRCHPELDSGSRCFAKGFTLIELLVVVLIIGILAAIALPQYQKAVEKSRATQALSLLRSMHQAERVYTMTHGAYPNRFSQLDLEIPYSDHIAGRIWYTGAHDTLTNTEWTAQIVNYSYWHMLAVGRVSGPYQGAGWVIYEKYQYGDYPLNVILCTERSNSTNCPFQKTAGDYCEKLFHGTRIGNTNLYRIP